MKRVLIVLLFLGIGFGFYSNYLARKKQNELLAKEVATLQKQNEKLFDLAEKKDGAGGTDPAKLKRIQDLQTRLDVENKKLADFRARKDSLTSAISDPGRASSLNEFSQEIKEKTDAIQSLQSQLSANLDDEKIVDHNGEQARQYQNIAKAQNLADLNVQIRNQQSLVQNTEAKIKQLTILATAESMEEAARQQVYLVQEKNDLLAMRNARDQINVASAVQSSEIHDQVGYAKGSIRASEQEIRANIVQLKADVKALEAQNNGAKNSMSQVKQQMNYVDQQIATEKDAISRIQDLIKAENQ